MTDHPALQAFAAGFPVTLLHTGLTLVLLVLGASVYALLTPHKELALIRSGNTAAGVSLGGVLVGMAIPLGASLAASVNALEILLWGAATILVQLFVFRVTDVLLSGLPARIAAGETAAAALLVSAKLAVAVILACAVAG